MKAYEVTDGFNRICVESQADVELVVSEMRFMEWASGKPRKIDIQEIEVDSIPANDRWYMNWLRDGSTTPPPASADSAANVTRRGE